MGSHDKYGKKLIQKATEDLAKLSGPSVEINYGCGQPARIDATYKNIAIEIESRTSKQVRGAVLDLICHEYSNKLLVIIPAHMNNPENTAGQCLNILKRFCPEHCVKVLILEGTGDDEIFETDIKLLKHSIQSF